MNLKYMQGLWMLSYLIQLLTIESFQMGRLFLKLGFQVVRVLQNKSILRGKMFAIDWCVFLTILFSVILAVTKICWPKHLYNALLLLKLHKYLYEIWNLKMWLRNVIFLTFSRLQKTAHVHLQLDLSVDQLVQLV